MSCKNRVALEALPFFAAGKQFLGGDGLRPGGRGSFPPVRRLLHSGKEYWRRSVEPVPLPVFAKIFGQTATIVANRRLWPCSVLLPTFSDEFSSSCGKSTEPRRKIGIVVRFSVSPSGKCVENRVFPMFAHVDCRKRAVFANFRRIVSESVVFLRIFHLFVRKQRCARQMVPLSRVYHLFLPSCGGNVLRFVRRSSSPRVQEDLYTRKELWCQRSLRFLY